MTGDRRRVEQVLLNLLSNAVRFMDRGGAVSLTVDAWAQPQVTGSAGRPALRVRVGDTGGGIEPHDMVRLFRPFEQIGGGTTRAYEGTGLGLAISRRLADLMGGTIPVESRWQHGSTFTLVLPLDVKAGT
jgi:signal transduction histidine kinase